VRRAAGYCARGLGGGNYDEGYVEHVGAVFDIVNQDDVANSIL
jgi:hypothetical protein